MKKNNRNSIYQLFATDLERRIRHNQLKSGHRLPSLNEICRTYHISYKTAFRLYNELAEKGIIYSINGKGYFVAAGITDGERADSLPPVTEIVMLEENNVRGENTQFAGAAERAAELGLPIQAFSSIDTLNLTDSTGVILRYTSSFMRLYQKLEYRRLRVVLTNNYFPELHCVVCDNPDAMKQIITRMVVQYGCRKLICCGRHFTDLGQANLNEREYCFLDECKRHQVEATLLTSGNMQELYQYCEDPATCPDGIIFISNSAALTFDEERKKTPSWQKIRTVYFSSRSDKAISGDGFAFSSREMGRMAVDLLMNCRDEDWLLPNVCRIKGHWKSDKLESC
ncbi:MAG: GntR family transcriptional regulator [Lentisphaeria bacterium]|nr:GntR family transcriptional regulator [Lentisphaeria bacterium]